MTSLHFKQANLERANTAVLEKINAPTLHNFGCLESSPVRAVLKEMAAQLEGDSAPTPGGTGVQGQGQSFNFNNALAPNSEMCQQHAERHAVAYCESCPKPTLVCGACLQSCCFNHDSVGLNRRLLLRLKAGFEHTLDLASGMSHELAALAYSGDTAALVHSHGGGGSAGSAGGGCSNTGGTSRGGENTSSAGGGSAGGGSAALPAGSNTSSCSIQMSLSSELSWAANVTGGVTSFCDGLSAAQTEAEKQFFAIWDTEVACIADCVKCAKECMDGVSSDTAGLVEADYTFARSAHELSAQMDAIMKRGAQLKDIAMQRATREAQVNVRLLKKVASAVKPPATNVNAKRRGRPANSSASAGAGAGGGGGGGGQISPERKRSKLNNDNDDSAGPANDDGGEIEFQCTCTALYHEKQMEDYKSAMSEGTIIKCSECGTHNHLECVRMASNIYILKKKLEDIYCGTITPPRWLYSAVQFMLT